MLVPLLQKIASAQDLDAVSLTRLQKQHTKPNGDLFSKDQLVQAYRSLAGSHGLGQYSDTVVQKIQMKPIRTASGVAPITVLTKPFPCPGKCIFCPNDIRMPKSYLSDEPGAQRAERNYFDPYLQTFNRLQALHNIGHSVDKSELIVLGGTWSFYPETYQIWFIKECFRALNEFRGTENTEPIDSRDVIMERYVKIHDKLSSLQAHAPTNDPLINQSKLSDSYIDGEELDKTYNQVISETYVAPERKAGLDTYQTATWEQLKTEQERNETAVCRSVGLVVETRPDNISEAEVVRIRKLGCTKTQIGFQSLQDDVLTKNKRGHDVGATRRAVGLLRQAGFKIHAHWMANLYGSNVENDKKDYSQLFSDPDFMPDELKIYPCSLIQSAELMQYYRQGLWQPYSYEELLYLLSFCLKKTPQFCRLTRVVRDIPSTDIVEGNKLTNFRQIAEQNLSDEGMSSQDIRAREIRETEVSEEQLKLDIVTYNTSVSEEQFLQFVTVDNKIVAFLRLSLPKAQSFIEELHHSAIIREIHVYGKLVGIGKKSSGKAQHLGLGSKLIFEAKKIAKDRQYERLAVISAVGTREYYRKKGFTDGKLYQFMNL